MQTSHHKNFDQLMRGYLLIHVGGYKMVSDTTFHVFSDGTDMVSVPDRLVKAEAHPFGTSEFYEDGWAVGDNPRDRFCKWNGIKPMRRFHDFDEAVAHVYRLRQKRKRPNEIYTLMYVTKGVNGKDCSCAVSSLDDIVAFEATVSEKIAQNNSYIELRQQNLRNEYPDLDRLREAFGLTKAYNLSMLLKSIRQDGQEKTMQSMPKSSFYRCARELRKLGLLD